MEYRQLLVASVACGGGFVGGTTLGWSSPSSGPVIKDKAYNFVVTELQFAWIVGLLALGGVFSAVPSGVIRSKIGTRKTISLFGISMVAGWLFIVNPLNPGMLMAGRFLQGIGVGSFILLIPLYIGEIAADHVRGSLLSIGQVSSNLGLLFAFILGRFTSLTALNIVCTTISALFLLGFNFLPESPGLLVSQDRGRDAEESLKKLNKKSFDTKAAVALLKSHHEQRLGSRKTFSEVWSIKSTRKAFLIVLLQFLFLQTTGMNVVQFYSTKIFTEAGVNVDPGISSIVIATVQLFCSILTYFVVDRFGRKSLLIFAYISMFVGLLGIGTFFMIKNTENLQWLPLTSVTVFMIANGFGMAPPTFVLLGEMFLQEAKMFLAPIAVTFNLCMIFLVGLIFPLLVLNIGMGHTFFIISVFCILGLLFTIFVIPETKGKSNAEIQDLLK